MTNEPIKKDYGKNGNNYDEAKNNSILRRCKNAARDYARKNFTVSNIFNAVVPNKKQVIATPLEILVAGLAFQNLKLFKDPLKHAKSAMQYGRFATKTMIDAAKGGPEGMLAAIKLEEAIQILEEKSATDYKAAQTLKDYYSSKKEFVKELVDVYKENENYARVCNRIAMQMRGMVKNLMEIGNDIPFIDRVDSQVALGYIKVMLAIKNPAYEKYRGMNSLEMLNQARKDNQLVGEIYNIIKDFYDGKELSENTTKEFCDFLRKNETMVADQNKKLESYFPQIIDMVKKGYKIEDILMELESRGINIREEEVKGAEKNVKLYREQGKELRSEIKKEGVPMKDDLGYNLVDIATNPFVVAAAAVLAYKGLTRSIPGMGFADDQISKLICLPATGAWYGAKQAVKGVKTLYNKGKQYLSGGKNENPEGTSN